MSPFAVSAALPVTPAGDDDFAPVDVRRPRKLAAPLVFASPHSGRNYPCELVARSILPLDVLRRSEDAYIDELFASAPAAGAPLVSAAFPRVFLDANRGADEIDPDLFEGGPAGAVLSARAAAGLGVVPRVGADGRALYRERLSPEDGAARLSRYYHPYHAALEAEVKAAERAFGFAILIDAHSMPSAGARGADAVIGDRHGISCAPGVTDAVEAALRAQGLRTARNTPYAGGYTTVRYGRPETGRHAVQVEINRSLYLDEANVTRSGTFAALQARMEGFIAALIAADWAGATA